MTKDTGAADGGPAFPVEPRSMLGGHDGMNLRDWFAGQALAGMIGNSGLTMSYGENHPESNKVVAAVAYILADAMIAERSKP
jgi:hypothetical protein